MDWANIVSFVFVASLLVMSPGPNGVLIAKTVPTSGRAAGFANVAGFVTAFYVHGALSILGISVLLLQSAQAFFVVKMIGAAYLCWIGLMALRDAYRGGNATRRSSAGKTNPDTSISVCRRVFDQRIEPQGLNVLSRRISAVYYNR